MKCALEYLLQTKVGTSEQLQDINMSSNQCYQANICVICDEFIIGTSVFVWLPKSKLLKHKMHLWNPDICKALRRCYQVDDEDLNDILLARTIEFWKRLYSIWHTNEEYERIRGKGVWDAATLRREWALLKYYNNTFEYEYT